MKTVTVSGDVYDLLRSLYADGGVSDNPVYASLPESLVERFGGDFILTSFATMFVLEADSNPDGTWSYSQW